MGMSGAGTALLRSLELSRSQGSCPCQYTEAGAWCASWLILRQDPQGVLDQPVVGLFTFPEERSSWEVV